MKTIPLYTLTALVVIGMSTPVFASPLGGCPTISTPKNEVIFDKAAQAAIQQSIMKGCDPVYPQRRGGFTGEMTSEDSLQSRVKTPPNAPSLKYKDVAPVAGCDANTFGKPGGSSSGGTTTHCEKGPADPLPAIVPPDMTEPPEPTNPELNCLKRLSSTFRSPSGAQPFSQMCAYAGVKICNFTFEQSGCIGDQEGDGGPAPPDGFFTFTGPSVTLGLYEDYLRGPFYLHYGGTLTLPDGTEITVDQQRFVYVDEEDRVIRVYDNTPVTYYEYTWPPTAGDTDTVDLRAADSVIYVALCSIDDSCFPE